MRAISKGVHGTKDFVRRTSGLSEHNLLSQTSMSGSNLPESDTASVAISTTVEPVGKPWKKHHNRNKKEKIKRTH